MGIGATGDDEIEVGETVPPRNTRTDRCHYQASNALSSRVADFRKERCVRVPRREVKSPSTENFITRFSKPEIDQNAALKASPTARDSAFLIFPF